MTPALVGRKDKSLDVQLPTALALFGVDVVLDVGANVGQYAMALRRQGFTGRIVSFEPLPEPHAALVRQASADPRWQVAARMAVGERDGEVLIERSAESDMSSILPQGQALQRLSPTSAIVEHLEVPLRRLDSLADVIPASARRLFLKMDVQGYEENVLAGADALWPRIAGIQLELPLVPLYEGERDWRSQLDRLEARGYVLHLLFPGYFERHLGRQLQVDAVLFRRDLVAELEAATRL